MNKLEIAKSLLEESIHKDIAEGKHNSNLDELTKSLIRDAIYDELGIEKGKIFNAVKSGAKKAAVIGATGALLTHGGAKIAQMDTQYNGPHPSTHVEQAKDAVIKGDKKLKSAYKKGAQKTKQVAGKTKEATFPSATADQKKAYASMPNAHTKDNLRALSNPNVLDKIGSNLRLTESPQNRAKNVSQHISQNKNKKYTSDARKKAASLLTSADKKAAAKKVVQSISNPKKNIVESAGPMMKEAGGKIKSFAKKAKAKGVEMKNQYEQSKKVPTANMETAKSLIRLALHEEINK